MAEFARTPSIDVTIGGQARAYHAFITTAPLALDGPSTMTLQASTFEEVSWLAADPIAYDTAYAKTPTRLVLIESKELAWHRATYRAARWVCAPADPVLVCQRTLQYLLWRRLQFAILGEELT